MREVDTEPGWGERVVIAGAGFGLVDKLAVLYLALPIALFFAQWFKPWFGVPLALASLAGLPYLLPLKAKDRGEPLPGGSLAFAATVAAVWTLLSGAGHFFYANYFDWHIRDAVLRDLAVMPVPP